MQFSVNNLWATYEIPAAQAAEAEVVKMKELIRVRGCNEEFIADPAFSTSLQGKECFKTEHREALKSSPGGFLASSSNVSRGLGKATASG